MSCSNTGGRRRSRKMRGGNGYGFGEPIAVGALRVEPNLTSVVGGAPYKPMGGRRRRKSRKGKSRRSRRRTMRGGGSVSSVGAGFTGSGSRGIADYVGYESNVPVGGAFAIPTGTR
jgi:hypothetical protein